MRIHLIRRFDPAPPLDEWLRSREERGTMRIIEFATFVVIFADIAACSADRVAGGGGPVVTRITVSPTRDTIVVGQTATLIATALDDAGRPVQGVTFAWTSSEVRVAPVTPAAPSDTARSTGDSVGVTQITATVGSVRSLPTSLTVMPPTDPSDTMAHPPAPPVIDSVPGTTDTTKTALIACGGVNQRVRSFTAHILASYAYATSGVDTMGYTHTYDLKSSADLTERLDLLEDDTMFAYFRGDQQGTATIHDRWTEDFNNGDTAFGADDGSGPILSPVDLGYARGFVYLTINKTTCKYQFYAPSAYVMATLSTTNNGGTSSLQMPDMTGILYSRYFPIEAASGTTLTMSGHGAFVVGEWINMNPFDINNLNPPTGAPPGYYWGGSLQTMSMLDYLASSGKAGAADVSWSFTPVR